MTSVLPLRKLTAALLCALCLLAAAAQAQPDNAPLTMNMRDADIRALIQWVADYTGKNIIVHKDVQGPVTVISNQPVTPEEAYQVFLNVLQVHGYAAIETDGALKVLPAATAQQGGIPFGADPGDGLVVSVFKLENISASQLANTLRPLVTQEGVLQAHTETNVIVVADHAQNIASIRKLVARMDRAGDTAIELVRLEHASAADVLESLTALLPAQATAEGGALGIRLAMDERSNSILLSGDPAKRKQFVKLIQQLDEPLAGEGNTQVIYLHYVDAEELVPILQSVAKSIETEQKTRDSAVSIEASTSSNALVINAPPAMLASMRRVVEQLDIRRAQVLIESMVVEVSGDVARDLGVTWITSNAEDIDDSDAFAAVNTLGQLESGEILRDDAGNIVGVVPGRGFTFGYFDNGNLQATLRALKTTTNANILSTPTVVALDNEEASLLVGQNVPFVTGQATGPAADVDNPFTTIEREDIGIELTVIPRINRGDAVTLEIKQTVENLAPSVENAADIVTNKREIVTKALVRDDQVLVLGGLISDEDNETREKVPLLGDIPVLGRLFSSTSKRRTKRNLMVFIHPVILKDELQATELSRSRYEFMQREQERYREKGTAFEQNGESNMQDYETFSPIDGQRPVHSDAQ